MNIFVVDREPVVVAALRSFMGEHGHKVSTADSVRSLLTQVQQGATAPDLILIDLPLATEGSSFLEELSRSSPGTRIVVMSTEGAVLPAGCAVATDATSFLRKPIRFGDVEELLRETGSQNADIARRTAPVPGANDADFALPKRVLVVDDSPLIHTMYRTILRQKYPSCAIFKAMNGREALDLLATEGNIDLILLDINMPVMNGIQFLESLSVQKTQSGFPVIVVTTEGKEEDAVRGLRRGAKGYLVKPFRPEVLCQLIETVLKKERGRAR